MKKRILGFVLATVFGASLLGGCGTTEVESNQIAGAESVQIGEESVEAAEEVTESSEVQTLKVGILGKDIKTACIILAKESGYFEEEGVNVEFEQISSLAEAITAVDQGQLDILPYGSIPSCSFISQGSDLVIFGGTIAEGSECITRPENAEKYSDAESFKGAKIGCFRMETGHMVMKGWLREQGLDIDKDVEFIYLDSQASIMEAVQKGEVDLGFVNSGYGYICKQSGLEVAFAVGDYVADFPCCRQTTSRNAMDNKKDALIKFEMAALRGYELYKNDPETAVALLTAFSGQEEEYVRAIMYGAEGYENVMDISLDPDKEKVIQFYELMKENGDIDAETPYDIADHIDTSVYETAVENLSKRGE